MRQTLRSVWGWLRGILDDALPMPPDQRAARDDTGKDDSARRRLRLKLHLLQKRGRGGCR